MPTHTPYMATNAPAAERLHLSELRLSATAVNMIAMTRHAIVMEMVVAMPASMMSSMRAWIERFDSLPDSCCLGIDSLTTWSQSTRRRIAVSTTAQSRAAAAPGAGEFFVYGTEDKVQRHHADSNS